MRERRDGDGAGVGKCAVTGVLPCPNHHAVAELIRDPSTSWLLCVAEPPLRSG
jgi:hypothetical protein